MEKGARVRIVGGRQGKGQLGNIFWKGPDKFNGGERFGVKADDGETYWVSERDVEEATGAPPAKPAASGGPSASPAAATGESFQKGDRVAFSAGGREQQGQVFWTGPSKSGGGQRLGIKPEDGGETVWLDARFARPAGTAAPTGAHPDGPRPAPGRFDDDESPPWTPPLAADELPEAPPWDDDAIARFGAEDDEA